MREKKRKREGGWQKGCQKPLVDYGRHQRAVKTVGKAIEAARGPWKGWRRGSALRMIKIRVHWTAFFILQNLSEVVNRALVSIIRRANPLLRPSSSLCGAPSFPPIPPPHPTFLSFPLFACPSPPSLSVAHFAYGNYPSPPPTGSIHPKPFRAVQRSLLGLTCRLTRLRSNFWLVVLNAKLINWPLQQYPKPS